MPASLLWAVDVYGRVYSLSTAGQQWELCRDAHLEFKRVTAAQQCCWGIACDNNIYVNVHASDLPVRYQEDTYENQVSHPDPVLVSVVRHLGSGNARRQIFFLFLHRLSFPSPSPPDWSHIQLKLFCVLLPQT